MLRFLILFCAIYNSNAAPPESPPELNSKQLEINIIPSSDAKSYQCKETALEVTKDQESKVLIKSADTISGVKCHRADKIEDIILDEAWTKPADHNEYNAVMKKLSALGKFNYECIFTIEKCETPDKCISGDQKCNFVVNVVDKEVKPEGYLMINENSFISTGSNDYSFTEGNTLTLSCHRTAGDSVQLSYTTTDGKVFTESGTTEARGQVSLIKTVHDTTKITCTIMDASKQKKNVIEVSLIAKESREDIKPEGYLMINEKKFTSTGSNDYSFTEGDNMTLSCLKTAGDSVQLSYTSTDNKEFTESGTTELKAEVPLKKTVHDKTKIRCTIMDASKQDKKIIEVSLIAKESDIKPEGYLMINEKKFTSTGSNDYSFTEGDKMTLSCLKTAGDSVQLSYTTTDNKEFTESGTTELKAEVPLKKTVHDKTKIRCTIMDASKQDKKIIEVSLIAKESDIKPEGYLTINEKKFTSTGSNDYSFTEGGTMTLSCLKTAGDSVQLSYTTTDNKEFTESGTTEMKAEVPLKKTVHDKTKIRCTIMDASKQDKKIIEVSLIAKESDIKPEGYLMINEKKFTSTGSNDYSFTEGDKMTLSCLKTAGDSVQLSYTTTDNKEFTESGTTELKAEVPLKKTVHDKTKIRCTIMDASKQDKKIIEVSLIAKESDIKPEGYLMINEKKFTSTGPNDYSFTEGDKMTLSCLKTAGDSVQLSYTTTDGKVFTESGTTEARGQVSLIKTVHDTTKITCTIMDASKQNKKIIEVSLIAKESEEYKGSLSANGQTFTVPGPHEYSFYEGTPVQLKCQKIVGDFVQLSYTTKDGVSVLLAYSSSSSEANLNISNGTSVTCTILDALNVPKARIEVRLTAKANKPEIIPAGYLSVNDKTFASPGVHNYIFEEGENVKLICQNTTEASAELRYPFNATQYVRTNAGTHGWKRSFVLRSAHNNTIVECSINGTYRNVKIQALLTVKEKAIVYPTTNAPESTTAASGGSTIHYYPDNFTFGVITAMFVVITAVF